MWFIGYEFGRRSKTSLLVIGAVASASCRNASAPLVSLPNCASAASSAVGKSSLKKNESVTGLTNAEFAQLKDDLELATVGLRIVLKLADESTRVSVCTGVIAGENLILTAAHCFAPSEGPMALKVSGNVTVASSIEMATASEMLEIDQVAVHPKWNGWFHDLALVTTEKSLPANRKIPSFESNLEKLQPQTSVTMIGYGNTDMDRNDAGRMRRADSFIFNVIDKLNYPDTILLNQIRIKDTNPPPRARQACSGDSGGPAFLKDTPRVFGLVSGMNVLVQKAINCADGDVNYTLIAPYMDWIESTAGIKLNKTGSSVPISVLPPQSKDSTTTGPTSDSADRSRGEPLPPKSTASPVSSHAVQAISTVGTTPVSATSGNTPGSGSATSANLGSANNSTSAPQSSTSSASLAKLATSATSPVKFVVSPPLEIQEKIAAARKKIGEADSNAPVSSVQPSSGLCRP